MANFISTKKHIGQSEKAYLILKEMIIRGEIRQGEVLSIMLLSEQLQIGRTPISNAFQRLECEGLVRIIPKQGVLILTLSINDAREIYEARVAIESFFARKAFDGLTQKDVAILKTSMEKQTYFGEKKDHYSYIEEDTFFHRYFMNKYDNHTLTEMYDQLINRIVMFGIRSSSNASRFHSAIKEHYEIVRCIEEKDIAGFNKAIEQHIMNGYIFLTGAYKL
jgi:DNA-binding GntR family transcriptional regulator